MARLYGWVIKISWLGADHTYVTSSDGGVWGCWGRSSGGRTICSGDGSSRQANCLSQSSSHAGIVYGITGVCHQTANRILFPARVLVSGANGYWASVAMYGTYGTTSLPSLIEWDARKSRCSHVTGDLGARALAAPAARAVAKVVREPAPAPDMQAYLERVEAIYAEQPGEMRVAAMPAAKKADFLARELELMADYRLGGALTAKKVKGLQKVQKGVLQEKEALDGALIGQDISSADYARKVNDLMARLMTESGAQLGAEAHSKMFGMPPEAVFQIVDPKILARYHAA
ncbi:MAG: hypothetical protein AB9873_11510 [Syntrophobacteraceae bacterium]